ncbi:MAG: hypothetical protein RLZZ387_2098, partial [Chloroflexota bacterium]
DRKARTLLDWAKQIVRPNGAWTDERVIIFTEYRDTQKWLGELFAAEGLSADGRLMLLYGGMSDEDREMVKAAFQASPNESRVRILLATDAASEGIDLQRYCHRLVHYEIPWNPNRMEQRNGRIDRHGQRKNPQVFHFAPRGFASVPIDRDAPVGQLEGDLEFLMRAVQKVEQIREDLMGKVGPVIADQVTEAMLGTRRRLDTTGAERSAEPTRRMLTFERNLGEQIKRLAEQLEESRHALHLSPEHVQTVVEIALDLAGQPSLIEATADTIWPDPSGERRRCPVFHLPALRGSWGACAEGLEHPHTRKVRPIVFDHELAKGRDDVVLAHLNHQLVQMALRLLRAEVWSSEGRKKLHRVAARVIPNHIASTPIAVALGRLVVIGGDSHRLHEELIAAAGEIERDRFRRLNVGQTQAVLEAATSREPSPAVKDDLAGVWPSIANNAHLALEARAKERAESLQRKLEERRDKEIGDITRILEELSQAIENELAEASKPEQLRLDLFNESEREQYRRNVDELRTRLAHIPRELEQETSAIRARYADPQTRLFPVAVMFLVPERLVR